MKARPFEDTHCTIQCIDCGLDRIIKLQDKHQVVRCIECQKKYRIMKRNKLREVQSNAPVNEDTK